MYAEQLKFFENAENLGGKAWQHAVNIDVIEQYTTIKDCSIHCFHYQQMFEMLFKYTIATKSKDGLYAHSHKLNKLLENVIEYTDFKTDKNQYLKSLLVITVCAEVYRYNFLIDCDSYFDSILTTNELLKELILYLQST